MSLAHPYGFRYQLDFGLKLFGGLVILIVLSPFLFVRWLIIRGSLQRSGR